jgi:hypothetical protein
MKNYRCVLLLALAILLCGAQFGRGDMLSILITPSGTDYYQWTVTVGSNSFTSSWVTQTPAQTSFDSMATSPGNANNATVGTTQYFSLAANSGLVYSAGGDTFSVGQTGSSYWRENATDSTEAGLFITPAGTPSSSSAVQNLLILDGAGGIFTYKAPTLNGSGVVTNVNPSGVNAYGYASSWNPATQGSPLNVPITQLGTTTSGIEGALESNAGFVGTQNAGSNIAAGGEENISLPGGPPGLTSFAGYLFTGGNQPDSFREFVNGNFGGSPAYYITPSIYFEESTTLLPEPASIGVTCLCGSALLMRRRRN